MMWETNKPYKHPKHVDHVQMSNSVGITQWNSCRSTCCRMRPIVKISLVLCKQCTHLYTSYIHLYSLCILVPVLTNRLQSLSRLRGQKRHPKVNSIPCLRHRRVSGGQLPGSVGKEAWNMVKFASGGVAIKTSQEELCNFRTCRFLQGSSMWHCGDKKNTYIIYNIYICIIYIYL